MTNRNTMLNQDTPTVGDVLKAFEYDRLRLLLGGCSDRFQEMARLLHDMLPPGPGEILALQHLLASRDAALTAITDSLGSQSASQEPQDVSKEDDEPDQ